MQEVIQGRGGESHERGIQSAGGESRAPGTGGKSRAAGANRAKKAFCHVLLLQFFVNICAIKTLKIWYNLAALGKGRQGQSPTLVPLSCTLGLIDKFFIEEISPESIG